MTLLVLPTPCPPDACGSAAGGFCLATEPETMTTKTAAQGGTLSTSPLTATAPHAEQASKLRRVKRKELPPSPYTLPFTTTVRTRSGLVGACKWFDVPDEDYNEGWGTGLEAAGLILAKLQADGEMSFEISQTIRQIFAEQAKPITRTPSKRGAASAAISVLEGMLLSSTRHLKWDSWLNSKLRAREKDMSWLRDEQAKERQAFVDRMKAARAAKRAARQAEQSARGTA